MAIEMQSALFFLGNYLIGETIVYDEGVNLND